MEEEKNKKLSTSAKLSTVELVERLYKDESGKPITLSASQVEIFDAIYKRTYPRVHIMCPTQFGKSMTVALAVLTRAATFPEKWCIVAPSEKKAKIIMSYVIQHAFDNEYTSSKLELDKEGKDRLRRERSKQRITFRISGGRVGEIFILSADSRNKEKAGEALMGFGCIEAGYRVMTDRGEIEIDKVVKEKLDVKILSYSDEGKLEFKRILDYQTNPRGEREMIEVDLGDSKFRCTEDHPVFVEGRGYIRADALKEGDVCLGLV
jgi:hypothetical protein